MLNVSEKIADGLLSDWSFPRLNVFHGKASRLADTMLVTIMQKPRAVPTFSLTEGAKNGCAVFLISLLGKGLGGGGEMLASPPHPRVM